jgi:hypothetical protein
VDTQEIAQVQAEEQKAPEPEGQPAGDVAAAEQEPAPPGPADVCGQIIEAAKAKDEGKLLALCTPGSAEALAATDKDAVFTAIATGACGAAEEDGDKATVALAAGEKALELPLTKVADAWKFDTVAYLAKYPRTAKKPEPGKKKRGKKKRGKKKRGKKKNSNSN